MPLKDEHSFFILLLLLCLPMAKLKMLKSVTLFSIFSLSCHFHFFLFLFLFFRKDVPLVKLEFGTNPVVEGNTVGEGADVYFECNIKANPTVYRVAWKHNVTVATILALKIHTK